MIWGMNISHSQDEILRKVQFKFIRKSCCKRALVTSRLIFEIKSCFPIVSQRLCSAHTLLQSPVVITVDTRFKIFGLFSHPGDP